MILLSSHDERKAMYILLESKFVVSSSLFYFLSLSSFLFSTLIFFLFLFIFLLHVLLILLSFETWKCKRKQRQSLAPQPICHLSFVFLFRFMSHSPDASQYCFSLFTTLLSFIFRFHNRIHLSRIILLNKVKPNQWVIKRHVLNEARLYPMLM